MGTQTGTSLRVTRVVAASPQRAFEAWTQPEQMRRWSCPEDARVAEVESDLKVGGRFRTRMEKPDGETYTAYGVYREIDPPNRLVYTWDWEEEAFQVGETIVTVEFHDLGESTEVVVTHEGFPAQEATEGHLMGWTSCLNQYEALFV